MNVCELLTILSRADPEDIVVYDTYSDCLLLITVRPGMHQVVEDCTGFTAKEQEWLRQMHIRW